MSARFNKAAVVITVAFSVLGAGCQTTPMSQSSQPPPASSAAKVKATPEAVEEAYTILAGNERAVAEKWRNLPFDSFEATVAREPDSGAYIVNGDIVIHDRKQLRDFYERDVQKAGQPKAGLILMVRGGVDAAWPDQQKHGLTYCVSNTFGPRQAAVEQAMSAAAGAWASVADITFIHVAAQDGACTAGNDQVLFDVRPISGGGYLARAFFPDDPRSQRNVLIDDSAFNLDPGGNLTLVGILRHELGHTLGFRHEHTRPEAGACFEDNDWRELTSYDAFSVMHYPQCNGKGDWSLTLTDRDRSGAACVYGSAPGFTIDPAICQVTPTPPSPCGEQSVTESGSVTTNQQVALGPYSTEPGTRFRAVMSGTGDPDLYVRYLIPPTVQDFDCRPFLTGASETCDLTVPQNAIQAHVMIRGYSAGDYTVNVTHTPHQ